MRYFIGADFGRTPCVVICRLDPSGKLSIICEVADD